MNIGEIRPLIALGDKQLLEKWLSLQTKLGELYSEETYELPSELGDDEGCIQQFEDFQLDNIREVEDELEYLIGEVEDELKARNKEITNSLEKYNNGFQWVYNVTELEVC